MSKSKESEKYGRQVIYSWVTKLLRSLEGQVEGVVYLIIYTFFTIFVVLTTQIVDIKLDF